MSRETGTRRLIAALREGAVDELLAWAGLAGSSHRELLERAAPTMTHLAALATGGPGDVARGLVLLGPDEGCVVDAGGAASVEPSLVTLWLADWLDLAHRRHAGGLAPLTLPMSDLEVLLDPPGDGAAERLEAPRSWVALLAQVTRWWTVEGGPDPEVVVRADTFVTPSGPIAVERENGHATLRPATAWDCLIAALTPLTIAPG